MTSTNMFQGLDNAAKPSSRVLRPPGGASSNLFGGYEDTAAPTRRANKTASDIFGPEEPRQAPTRRSNPPGGKASDIFGGVEAPAQQPKPAPPGRQGSNIFGGAEPGKTQTQSPCHPNKPKDNFSVNSEPEPPVSPQPKASPAEVKEEAVLPPAPHTAPAVAEIVAPPTTPEPVPEPAAPCPDEDSGKNHEPHLGPKPRSHNRVLNPPGGKSSVVFY